MDTKLITFFIIFVTLISILDNSLQGVEDIQQEFQPPTESDSDNLIIANETSETVSFSTFSIIRNIINYIYNFIISAVYPSSIFGALAEIHSGFAYLFATIYYIAFVFSIIQLAMLVMWFIDKLKSIFSIVSAILKL